jgi:enamidase
MRLKISQIGTILSGDISNPILKGDCIVVENNTITFVGYEEDYDGKVDKEIDARGMTVTPGLIDSHVHPVLGDFTPRQRTLDFIDSSLHGGVTTMISAGEAHTPGRPRDIAGIKALAILAKKSFENFRPSGVKVHAGALILEKGLVEKDFEEVTAQGVWLVGEIGLGSIFTPEDAKPMVEMAQKYGMKVTMHTGGTSIPGSSTVTADDVMAIEPDVVSHINGGPTAIAINECLKLVDETDFPLELVHCGNPKVLIEVINAVEDRGDLHRIIVGNDAPSGTGVIPLGILRTLCLISSIGGISGDLAVAMATGNTRSVFGLNTGIIEIGKEADLVIMDAPMGSVGNTAVEAIEAGDVPGIALVMIDGEIRVVKSRNTPPPERMVKIKEVE